MIFIIKYSLNILNSKYSIKHYTLKAILLGCELNFTDVAAVLVIAVSSVFSAATAVKTVVTAVNAVMILNFQTYVTTVLAAVASSFCCCDVRFCCRISISAVTTVFTAVAAEKTDDCKFNLIVHKISWIIFSYIPTYFFA